MRPTSLTATVVAVMAGSALMVVAPGASSAAPTRSSAYGLAVSAGGQDYDNFPATGGHGDTTLVEGSHVAVSAGSSLAVAASNETMLKYSTFLCVNFALPRK